MPKRTISPFVQNIGRRIAEIRAAKGWTQAVLAGKLGRSVIMVQIWERGINFKVETLNYLAKVLVCDVKEFFLKAKTPRPKPGRPRGK